MRLANRRPGWSTSFIDAATGDVLLEVSFDRDGTPLVAFCLYDEDGALVARTEGLERLKEPRRVVDSSGQLLLELPTDLSRPICYRLFTRGGDLLTCSDGVRTTIYGSLRMQGVAGGPPGAGRKSR